MKTNNKDKGYAPKSWNFDEEVTEVFADMLERSIPQYTTMRDLVATIVKDNIGDYQTVIDIGCSNGIGIEHVMKNNPNKCDYIGYEISQPMVDSARNRFTYDNKVRIFKNDLVKDRMFEHASYNVKIIMSVLTLMFIPIEHRQQVIADCYNALPKGGIFIVVEKILGETSDLNNMYNKAYYQMKQDNGYTQEEIDRKKMSLEGVLVPLTGKFNEQLIKSAGFKYIDCFWRWMNFAGWIAVK